MIWQSLVLNLVYLWVIIIKIEFVYELVVISSDVVIIKKVTFQNCWNNNQKSHVYIQYFALHKTLLLIKRKRGRFPFNIPLIHPCTRPKNIQLTNVCYLCSYKITRRILNINFFSCLSQSSLKDTYSYDFLYLQVNNNVAPNSHGLRNGYKLTNILISEYSKSTLVVVNLDIQ